MAYKIIYSSLAINTIDKNLNYLKNNWSKDVQLSFLDKVDTTISIIKENPDFYMDWNKSKNIKKAIIVKQITLFYQENKNTVEILLFWNNYKNPKSLIKLIK